MTTPAPLWIRNALEAGTLTLDDLAALVEVAQAALGVTVDGKPGPATLAALHARQPSAPTRATSTASTAIPANRHEVEAAYGTPKWSRPDPKKRAVKVPASWSSQMRSFTLHTGQKVRLHQSIGAEFVALYQQACEASGYTPSSVVGYVARTIGLTDRLSMHCYGIAVDFDPQQNPWGGKQSDGTPSLMRQYPRFYKVFEDAGWTWGGRWDSGKGDDMHMQRAGV